MTTLDEYLAKLPPGRREQIENRARTLILEEKIASAFREARQQCFEDGYQSPFAKSICELVETYDSEAVIAIGTYITLSSPTEERESIREALIWLGHSTHSKSSKARRSLLEQSLSSANHYVRDGAALGLESMGIEPSITVLRAAHDNETVSYLREYLRQLIEQEN